jgi:glycogen debranching enzyme
MRAGDGLLHYARGHEPGLVNQGWKDSNDSVFHADGTFPQGPIALIEVQGYAFAALQAMAKLAARRGERELRRRWQEGAAQLQARVEQRFWMSDVRFYALAVEGDANACAVRASNAGHLLYAGLAKAERGRHVAAHLLSPAFNSGWGLRTIARNETRYNPMSYHNGSVWPHDTALCAAGCARYGDRAGAVRLLVETFEAAVQFDMRLPELFCGFERKPGEPPIAYPVACLPQAWSAGSAFMLLQACLGIRIDAWRGEIHVDRPELPPDVERLRVQGIEIAGNAIDLQFERVEGRLGLLPDAQRPAGIHVLVHA